MIDLTGAAGNEEMTDTSSIHGLSWRSYNSGLETQEE